VVLLQEFQVTGANPYSS